MRVPRPASLGRAGLGGAPAPPRVGLGGARRAGRPRAARPERSARLASARLQPNANLIFGMGRNRFHISHYTTLFVTG